VSDLMGLAPVMIQGRRTQGMPPSGAWHFARLPYLFRNGGWGRPEGMLLLKKKELA
jgi:hypothetical protein